MRNRSDINKRNYIILYYPIKMCTKNTFCIIVYRSSISVKAELSVYVHPKENDFNNNKFKRKEVNQNRRIFL